jgi:RNA polymerase sigma factor (sigma-70 family)
MEAALARPKKKLGAILTGLVVAYYEDGNEGNLDKLFSALWPYLDRYCFAKLGIKCPARRQELVQETSIRILERLRARQFSYSTDEDGRFNSFLPWACRLQHNLFIDETRAALEPSKPSADEDPFLLVSAKAIALGGDDSAGLGARQEAALLLSRVAEAVATLTPKVRTCFEAYYYQGLNYDQIAALYGYNKVTCRGAVCKAMALLTKWATTQKVRPTEAIYEALPSLDTGDQFTDPTAHKNLPRGYYTRTNSQTRHYAKRALASRLAA